LEYGLSNLTISSLVKNKFTNIVCFSGRKDFEKSVKTLKDHGVKKVLMLFPMAVVGTETLEQVIKTKKTTAWKQNGRVLRKYVVFNTDECENFQITGEFLINMIDQIESHSHHQFDIVSLQPDENTYQFLEKIYDGTIPEIELLKNCSPGDQSDGSIIIERLKEIMLNNV
jgi:hypothetical protein